MGNWEPAVPPPFGRSNESGFGDHGLHFFVLVVVGVLFAVIVPEIYKARWRSYGSDCLREMLLVAEGGNPAEHKCPATGGSYTASQEDGREVLACPDPDRHLGLRPHFIREEERWRFSLELADATLESKEHLEFTTRTKIYSLTNAPEEMRIQIRRRDFLRFVLSPLRLLVGVALALVLGFFLIWWSAKVFNPDLTLGKKPKQRTALMRWTIAGLQIPILLTGSLLTFTLLYDGANGLFLHSQEIAVSRTGAAIRIRDFTFGKLSDGAERLENIKVYYPLYDKLFVIHEKGGSLTHQYLDLGGRQGAGAAARMLSTPAPMDSRKNRIVGE